MKLLRSFPLMCFTLVLLSIVGVCVAQQSVGFLLLAGTLAVMSWYVTEGPRGRHLPRWVSNVLIVAVSLNVFIELINAQEVMAVLGRFVVWLTLIKLYERKTPRDYGHLLALSLMLMIIGSVVSTDLLFGVVMALYSLLGLYVLLLYQLHADYERMRDHRRSMVPEGYRLAPNVRPIIGRAAQGQFRGLFAGIVVIGVASSLLVFLLMPRNVSMGLASHWAEQLSQTQQVETGFNEQVDLHTAARTTSHRTVMKVQVRDPSDRPIEFDGSLLLRGAVQDAVDATGRWVASSYRRSRSRDVPADRTIPTGRSEAGEDARLHTQHVQLYAPMRQIFSIWAPLSVEMSRPEEMSLDIWALTGASQNGGSLRSRSYVVHADRAPSNRLLRRVQRSRYPGWATEGRFPDDSRIRDHAEQILAEAGIDPQPPDPALIRETGEDPDVARWQWNRRASMALMQHLRSGRYEYTDDLSTIPVRTDIDPRKAQVYQFLFEKPRGDCNYFAAALAGMCHNLGVQARLVTGFVGYEYDPSEECYVIRQSNAHTWVEVRVGENVWATFDPTPPALLEEMHGGTRETVTDRLRWFYDRFEYTWRSEVVEFDRESQETIAQSVRGNWSEALSDAADRFQQWVHDFNRMFAAGMAGYIWLASAGVLIVLWLIVLAWLVRRMGRLRRALGLRTLHSTEAVRLLRQLGFYLDMLAVLDRSGRSKPHWQPPQAFSHELAAEHPDAGGIVQRITELFYAVRFGGRHLTAEETAEVRRLVEQLETTLRESR